MDCMATRAQLMMGIVMFQNITYACVVGYSAQFDDYKAAGLEYNSDVTSSLQSIVSQMLLVMDLTRIVLILVSVKKPWLS